MNLTKTTVKLNKPQIKNWTHIGYDYLNNESSGRCGYCKHTFFQKGPLFNLNTVCPCCGGHYFDSAELCS